jgi:hypothetical protein
MGLPDADSTADWALYFSILDLSKWDAAFYTDKLSGRSILKEMDPGET